MKKQILALALGLVTIGSFAQKKEIRAAEKAIKKGKFPLAVASIKSAEKIIANADDKLKSKFYFIKGQALAGAKDYNGAAEAYTQLLAFDKKVGKDRYATKAKEMINQLTVDISNEAIDYYSNKKDYKGAVDKFYLVYKLSPQDTLFVYNAAQAATLAEEYDTAIKYYKELQALGFTDVKELYVATNKQTGEVVTYQTKGKRDLAVKTGQSIKPETKMSESKKSKIVKNMAFVYKKLGQTDNALAAYKEARAANPDDVQLILDEAFVYYGLEKMDKFQALLKEATEKDPNNPTLFFNLGVSNANQGNVEEAKKYYNKAIELKPDYTDAYLNLAAAILSKEEAIVEEMNKNLSNFKKYDELENKQKELYKEALPYLEKADSMNRTLNTVKKLKNMYEILGDEAKAAEYTALYKSMI